MLHREILNGECHVAEAGKARRLSSDGGDFLLDHSLGGLYGRDGCHRNLDAVSDHSNPGNAGAFVYRFVRSRAAGTEFRKASSNLKSITLQSIPH